MTTLAPTRDQGLERLQARYILLPFHKLCKAFTSIVLKSGCSICGGMLVSTLKILTAITDCSVFCIRFQLCTWVWDLISFLLQFAGL